MYENGRMRHVETMPAIRGGKEENHGGDKFNYDIL
jgi:hypothetical protein